MRSFPDVAAAEHWILSRDPVPAVACTHLRQDPRPHVVVTLNAAAGGRLVPFETRHPTPCCADH